MTVDLCGEVVEAFEMPGTYEVERWLYSRRERREIDVPTKAIHSNRFEMPAVYKRVEQITYVAARRA